MGWNDHIEKKKTNKRKADAPARSYDAKFLNVDLSSEEKAKLKTTEYTPFDMSNHLEKYCEEYKVTLKWDAYSNACAAFMSPIDKDHENAAYVLTGRGSSILKAFRQLMYIHEVLCPEGLWNIHDKQRVYDIDD